MVRFETVVALTRLGREASGKKPDGAMFAEAEKLFDGFVDELGSTEITITVEIGHQALFAAKTFGKVVGHKAALNFGDCYSYAAAKALGVGLLYKGNDFALTDLA